jgi:hypothetical protein
MLLAERYRDLCESHGLGQWGAESFDYQEFLKGLQSISELPVCPGCLNGGGRDDCEMRRCASDRGIGGCGACADDTGCPHRELLEHMRAGARRAGLVVVESAGLKELLKERREQELASAWWWRALFDG